MDTLTLPLDVSGDPRHTTERVTARVLRRVLVPVVDPLAVASEIAELAEHRSTPILGALQRLDRASRLRHSDVLHRAEMVLCAALRLTGDTAATTAA